MLPVLLSGQGRILKQEGPVSVRPYDVYNERLCHLTPRPFLCRRCLQKGERIVQIFGLDEEGRPYRMYECRKWKRPYLE